MTRATAEISYQITIGGRLRESWADSFDGLELAYDDEGNTILSGFVRDQAALRGILNQIWDLNMVLISVSQLRREVDGNAASML